MSDIKSYQRLLAVQALYETSINTKGLDAKFEDLVSHIVDNVDFKNKIKDKKLLLTEEIYKGVLSNLKKIKRNKSSNDYSKTYKKYNRDH